MNFLILLILIPSLAFSQDCYNDEDNRVCCYCEKQWQCSIDGLKCSRTTTDFQKLTTYVPITETAVSSGSTIGLICIIALGVALGIVLSVAIICMIACPTRVRSLLMNFYSPLATGPGVVHFSRRCGSKDSELGSSSVSIYFDACDSTLQ